MKNKKRILPEGVLTKVVEKIFDSILDGSKSALKNQAVRRNPKIKRQVKKIEKSLEEIEKILNDANSTSYF